MKFGSVRLEKTRSRRDFVSDPCSWMITRQDNLDVETGGGMYLRQRHVIASFLSPPISLPVLGSIRYFRTSDVRCPPYHYHCPLMQLRQCREKFGGIALLVRTLDLLRVDSLYKATK